MNARFSQRHELVLELPLKISEKSLKAEVQAPTPTNNSNN
jgi:hypothetical protein